MSSPVEKFAKIGEFTLVNLEKLDRAIYGSVGKNGELVGGVGEKAGESAILAEYDRLGGLIRKGKRKVKTGSFFDFDRGEARAKPEVILVLNDLDGNVVEISGDEELSPELVAAENIAEKKKVKQLKKIEEADAKKATVQAKKKAGKKKSKLEDDEDESEAAELEE